MNTSVDSSFSSVDTDHLSGSYFNVISEKELEAFIKAIGGDQLRPEDAKKLADYITNMYSKYTLDASDGTNGFGQAVWDGGLSALVTQAVENFIATGLPFMIPQGSDGLCQVDYNLAFCIDNSGDHDRSVSESELAIFLQSVKPGLTDSQAKILASAVFDQFTDTSLSGGERSVFVSRFIAGNNNACKLAVLLNIIKHPDQVAFSDKCTDEGMKDLLFPLIDKDSNNSISRAELKDYYLERGKSPEDAHALVELHFSKLNNNREGGITIGEFTVPKKVFSGTLTVYDYVAPLGALTTDSIFTEMDTDLDGAVSRDEMESYYLTKFNNNSEQAKSAVDSVFGSITSGKQSAQSVKTLSLSDFKAGGGLNLMNMMEDVVSGATKELYAKQADGSIAKWDATAKAWKDVTNETWDDYLASGQKDAAYTVDTGKKTVAVIIGDASTLSAPRRSAPPVNTSPPMQGDFFIKVGDSYLGVKKQGEEPNFYFDVFEYSYDGALISSYTGDPHVDENGDGQWDWHFSNDSSFVLSNGAKVSFGTEQWGSNADVKVIDSITISTGGGTVTYDSDTI